MNKKGIAFIITLLVALQLHAQSLKIGAEAGLSGSVTLEKFENPYTGSKNISNQLRYGGRFGLPIACVLSEQFEINSGIYWTMKGIDKYPPVQYSTERIAYSTLELPLCFNYVKKKLHRNTFFIGVGVYFGYGLLGSVRYYDNTLGIYKKRDASWGKDPFTDDIKHFEWGGVLQAGLVMKSGLICRLIIQHQFNDMAVNPGGYLFTQIKNQAYASLSVAYFLKHKNKH
jgi:hypothetical protein